MSKPQEPQRPPRSHIHPSSHSQPAAANQKLKGLAHLVTQACKPLKEVWEFMSKRSAKELKGVTKGGINSHVNETYKHKKHGEN
jgi:hypothetical protein